MSDPLVLAVADHRIELDTAGDGRAISWSLDGLELLGGRSSDPVEHGMYAMGPWAGRIASNRIDTGGRALVMPATYGEWALHGTVIGRRCRVVSQASDAHRATAVTEVDLGPTWPWPGTLRSTWELTADALHTTLTLFAGSEPFPGVVGWHPWFRRELAGRSARWTVDDAVLAERGEDYRLTGRLVPPDRAPGGYDDAFRGSGRAVLEWPGVLRIDIASSHPWFVVFDMLPDQLCVEPQSGPPNGVNDGLGDPVVIVRPGRPLELRTRWRLSRGLPQG